MLKNVLLGMVAGHYLASDENFLLKNLAGVITSKRTLAVAESVSKHDAHRSLAISA